jgi:hypothetical protein
MICSITTRMLEMSRLPSLSASGSLELRGFFFGW